MTDWKWLIHPELGTHRVPDNPGVVELFEGRGWQATDIDGELRGDDEEFQAELVRVKAGEDVAELKGKALDDALDKAGLPKSGTVDEKRQRLAEHEAVTNINEANDVATDPEKEDK